MVDEVVCELFGLACITTCGLEVDIQGELHHCNLQHISIYQIFTHIL
jgi:hypothetical protein